MIIYRKANFNRHKTICSAASSLGSFGAIIMFVITLSFALSTPGVWQAGYGFPYLSGLSGQFLAKDILLLGAAAWTVGEPLRASASANRRI